jgi:hypothetical protein
MNNTQCKQSGHYVVVLGVNLILAYEAKKSMNSIPIINGNDQ